MRLPLLFSVVLLAGAIPAAAQADSAAAEEPARLQRRDPNRLTPEEIAADPAASVHDLVRRLRPRWLAGQRGRTTLGGGVVNEVSVFEGTQLMGTVAYLRSLPLAEVVSLQYYSPSAATNRFGRDHNSGAIVFIRRQ